MIRGLGWGIGAPTTSGVGGSKRLEKDATTVDMKDPA